MTKPTPAVKLVTVEPAGTLGLTMGMPTYMSVVAVVAPPVRETALLPTTVLMLAVRSSAALEVVDIVKRPRPVLFTASVPTPLILSDEIGPRFMRMLAADPLELLTL